MNDISSGPATPVTGPLDGADNTQRTDALFAMLQRVLPQHTLSALMHRLARSQIASVKNALIGMFIRRYGVDMTSAARSDPRAYVHFNDFFTRALREDARPQSDAQDAVLSPVDGRVSQAGRLRGSTLFQAKGRSFDLHALLGGSATRTERYRDGHYATLYLSPRDYHRIHMPVSGTLRSMTYVPGRLFSVNPATTRAVAGLFARNERVISEFDTNTGPMALILVGAIFVGSIETVWHGQVTPPRGTQTKDWCYDERSRKLDRRQEMGRFNMGSTVIMLFGGNAIEWSSGLRPGEDVSMGLRIGTLRP